MNASIIGYKQGVLFVFWRVLSSTHTMISRHIAPKVKAAHPNDLFDQVQAARLLRRRQTKCQF